MSSNPGAVIDIPDELAGPLEESLAHLVEHSDAHAGSQKDELAREPMTGGSRLISQRARRERMQYILMVLRPKAGSPSSGLTRLRSTRWVPAVRGADYSCSTTSIWVRDSVEL